MKKLDRIGSVLLVLALMTVFLFGLSGCGGNTETGADTAAETPVQEAAAPEEPAEAPEAESVAGSYDFTFDGNIGPETLTFTLEEDGTATLKSDGGIGPWYATYTSEGNEVSLSGISNPNDAISAIPGLWPNWIDTTTGDAVIILDIAAGTYEFVDNGNEAGGPSGEASGEADSSSSASGEASYFDGEYEIWENYPYGELSGQTLNAKFKEQPGARPVLFVVPGGAFRFVDNGHLQDFYDYFVEQGYLVVQINYTVGADTYPQAIIDVKSAVQYVVDNAAPMHADVSDMTILGCSAGGYLAAMAAFTDGGDFVAEGVEDYTYSLKALVDFFGATQWMTEDYLPGPSSPEASWIGSDIAAMADELDPLSYLDAGDVAKVWISHGTADTTMDIGQSEQFYDGCVAVLGADNVHFETIEDAGHEGAAFYTAENFALVDTFLSE